MDNLLRPMLISERGRIPFLVVFLGVLGGLAAFGLVGVFLGPVVVSVGFALVVEFSRTPLRTPEGVEPS
jgi:predicted PurR-regulated permease PerM